MKYTFFIIPAIIFVFFMAWSGVKFFGKYKRKRIITPGLVVATGIFLTAMALFWPIYALDFKEDIAWLGVIKTLFLSVHHAIRLFVVDSDFEIIKTIVGDGKGWVECAFQTLAAIIFILAPLTTFTFIISLFKDLLSYIKYMCYFRRDVYIFSELNNKSLILAENIAQNNDEDKKPLFVFADVFANNEEVSFELIEKAKELKAVCFKKDILSLNFGFGHKGSMKIFLIGEDEGENTTQALELAEQCDKFSGVDIYVFATGKDSELLLSNAKSRDNIKIKRINPIRAFTYDELYNNGEEIFSSAKMNSFGEKEISAVIVGLGEHGFEMLKALTWLCQMDGYFVRINAFDISNNAKSKVMAKCPELMNPEYNNKRVYDDAKYDIEIHPGVDVQTTEFYEKLKALGNITYIYISLGNDRINIEVAEFLRSELKKMGMNPIIKAVVYNSQMNKVLKDAKCMGETDEEKCKLGFVGSLESTYSKRVIIKSELEQLALERHKKHSDEEAFWKYEYNYRSSMTSAIHIKMRKACKMKGAEKEVNNRSEEEMNLLRIIEHNRWNAYMRTEGYSKGSKNHITKTHNMLVPFNELPPDEQKKDDV